MPSALCAQTYQKNVRSAIRKIEGYWLELIKKILGACKKDSFLNQTVAEVFYYVNYVNVNYSVKNSTVDCKYLLYFL